MHEPLPSQLAASTDGSRTPPPRPLPLLPLLHPLHPLHLLHPLHPLLHVAFARSVSWRLKYAFRCPAGSAQVDQEDDDCVAQTLKSSAYCCEERL